jgi:hypothetical protein
MGTGALLDQESGTDLEARQSLRNIANMSGNDLLGTLSGQVQSAFGDYLQPGAGQQYLTSLFQSPSDPFAAGGIYEQYLPLIEQQKNTLLNDVQQRAIAGMPASMSPAMSGGELARIYDATANQIAPSYQALFANLTRENMARQQEAANSVMGQEESLRNFVGNATYNSLGAQAGAASDLMRFSQPDPFASALSNLGAMLTASNLGFGGGSGGTGGGLMDILGSILGGGSGGTGGGLMDILGSIFGGGGMSPADIEDYVSGGGGGLLGSLSGLLSGAGGALAGLAPAALPIAAALAAGFGMYNWGANNEDSDWVKLSPIAWLGAYNQKKENKAMFLQQDQDSQRDQVFEIGNIGGQFLQAFGAPASTISSWTSYVNNLAATSESPADEQGLAATRLGSLLLPLAQAQGYTTLDAVPELRSTFISYLTSNTFTSGNSSYSGGAPANLIESWAGMAGLAEGGTATRPTMAMVGERGPELAMLAPGSTIVPNAATPRPRAQSAQNALAGIVPFQKPARPVRSNRGIGDMVSGIPTTQMRSGVEEFVKQMLNDRIMPMNRFATGRGIGALANAY